MKLWGISVILLAALTLAGKALGEKKRHFQTLRCCCRMMEQLRAELVTRMPPMAELIARLQQQAHEETAVFLSCLSDSLGGLGEHSFSELWREAAERCLSSLTGDEREQICSLGHILGQYELQEQLQACDVCLASLQRACKACQEAYPNERRLILGTTLTAGCFLAIILF